MIYSEIIRRRNATLSIGVVYSGRLPSILPKWLSSLARAVRLMDLPQKPELFILDNSDSMSNILKTESRKYDNVFRHVSIVPYQRTLHWTTERMRRDRVAEFMADACNRLRGEMTGDVHWIVEDDILVPPLGGRLLWNHLTAGLDPIHAVAGCYKNRHLPDTYVGGWWNHGSPKELEVLPLENSLIKVDFTGTGCLMYWRERTPRKWQSHIDGIPAHDWEWGLALKAAGGQLFMDSEVRCAHVVNDETILEA